MLQESYTPRPLQTGVLANAKGTIFTARAGFRTIVDSIVYFNSTGGALVCDTYINDGTERGYDKHSVPATTRYIAVDKNAPLYLEAGYLILANTTAAGSVSYFIFGQEKQLG